MKIVRQVNFFSTFRTSNNLIALAILAITLPTIARADITLPSVIADHMVLQREMVIPIWGRAKAGKMVDVSIVDGSGKVINSVQVKSGDDGKFMARLPAMSACKNPLMMKVACAGESVQCSDVLVGEVWLCGGQSNMEWKVQGSIGGDTLAQTLPATVRCFTPDRRMSAHPEADLPKK
jgi:sialate O-acetylesterase